MTARSGIIGAGNWIVDTTKIIDVYPSQDTLANIQSEEKNNGGGAFNILVDLAKMGADFPPPGAGSRRTRCRGRLDRRLLPCARH